MSSVFSPELSAKITRTGIVAVIVLESENHVAPLADALREGGVNAVELALRTPRSLEALRVLRRHAPEMLVGAGTVLLPEQVARVREAGADFAVAPGTNRRVLEAAAGVDLPFGPGIVTPSDIEAALEFGCNVLKFFPAEPSGGLKYLRNMIAPYQHLGLRYIPLGGLAADNISPYAADPNVLAIGGSWIAPKVLIEAEDWTEITARARVAVDTVKQNRQS
ncbi:bifunctional 4-hydroxy-2-oxoglutarate aldolase/2-dehydro-3-deoxy-phosphogluconate aldolase [Ruficoccus amylovorans]|uniref:Bifunctional 4-hydroxy-2-oxoglutarate aldolase/2-dehydro-3-deoxy-phosphogluconate aldolase n=1 Tax=Ruficoccus amylovorans TaxID=1804625 RepID=A0A842HCU4_9BACT|nr:bifunctional 4-hydroxy-2-oxoglutarate aldolase/2-dehydro-3-deoxy-phosphogluconate aldolase [Ruficoccus amylovorans]MBC2594070.1 bifunctional 4-hydroxy-2-oxoglutarate aldolase/2-dehydro-3-deoxy-phosphogluconate aldolase [Ruficoccus amylovorans]